MIKPKFTISAALLCLALAGRTADAQVRDDKWTAPYRLSRLDTNVVDRDLVADRFGYFHVFWIEHSKAESRYSLVYARFDGERWSPTVLIEDVPNIWAGFMTVVDATIDSRDRIHVTWGGNWGPVSHRFADIRYTTDIGCWSPPVTYDIRAFNRHLFVDAAGAYHLVYTRFFGEEPRGVLYQRSTDAGASWSQPVNLDPGMPAGQTATNLDFDFDGRAGLHGVWARMDMSTYLIKSVLYARSVDGGGMWETPFVVDEATQANPEVIRMANPKLGLRGSTVVVIWGGGGTINVGRRCRFSTDSGRTWGRIEQLFGELHGLAGTDGSAFDSTGRLHFVTQVRWPQGVYLAAWQNGVWSNPSLLYLIARDAQDIIGDRIHAQYVRLAVSSSDQFVTTFESCGAGCRDTSNLPNNAVIFAMNTAGKFGSLPPLVSVSSASFMANGALAPDSIAAGFGSVPVAGNIVAPGPPPLEMAGISVEVIDSAGVGRPAPLFLVSPGQTNYLVPVGTAPGPARLRVRGANGLVAAGTARIEAVAPALYSANSRGTGVAAGGLLRIAPNGSRTYALLFDPSSGQPVPLDVGAGHGEVYLELFGTGFRGYASGVTATVSGTPVPVLAVAAHGEYAGLDQINLGTIPSALAGRGAAEIRLRADGRDANAVTVLLK